ncbi:MAG: N5-glutamine methyltransferase family protein [Actinomycetota bacterium]
MSEPKQIKELLQVGQRVLEDSSHVFEDHDNEDAVRQLLAAALRVTEDELDDLGTAHEPPLRERERYLALVARRAAGEPLPFLTGRIDFYGLDLQVKPGAFVPRPSSELTVERAVKRLKRKSDPIALDVCTGAGPIALAMAAEVPQSHVWGTDIAPEAVRHGRSNARRLGIDNVTLVAGDLFGPLPKRIKGRVDVVTAHVPYVPSGELEDLPSEVKDFEPLYTLTDHSLDGIGLMRAVVIESVEWLAPGGWLLLEMSEDMTGKVKKMCRRVGFEEIGVADDEDDLSVVVEARKPRR